MNTPKTSGIVIMPCEVDHEASCARCNGVGHIFDRESLDFEGMPTRMCPACLGGRTQAAAALVAQGHKEDS